jgi:hypothetical protein
MPTRGAGRARLCERICRRQGGPSTGRQRPSQSGAHLRPIAAVALPPDFSRISIKDDRGEVGGPRDHPATDAIVESNGSAFGDRIWPERKRVVLLQEWLLAASRGQTIAFCCRALPEIAEPSEIVVGARLEQENLDFMHGRSMAAVGHDVLDNAATGASQFVQSLKPRHPHGQIDVLAFMAIGRRCCL